jgi:hypothetical protein
MDCGWLCRVQEAQQAAAPLQRGLTLFRSKIAMDGGAK